MVLMSANLFLGAWMEPISKAYSTVIWRQSPQSTKWRPCRHNVRRLWRRQWSEVIR